MPEVRAVCGGFGNEEASVGHLDRVVERNFDRDDDHVTVRSDELDEFATSPVECGSVVEAVVEAEADVGRWKAGIGIEAIGESRKGSE